ncbi:MAG: hypothetical protein ACQESF_02860 [Nanobdellota archaeon]
MHNKKSQLTIFVIIGLIILLAFGFMLFIQKEDLTEVEKKAETEDDELSVFVSECLKQTMQEALVEVGMHGGYLNLETKLPDVNDRLELSRPYLSMFDGNLKIPYWYHETGEDLYESQMPPLERVSDGDNSIQSQLERYIENNLNKCLMDFESFEKQNIKVDKKGENDVKITFTQKNVLASLDMPLELNKNSSVVTRDKFKASVPVRMKKVYSLAKDIMEHEVETAFLENRLRDLINSYSRIDGDYLPPMYGGAQMTSCSEREFWIESEVKKDFQEMLVGNIPFIQVKNAMNKGYRIDTSVYEKEDDAKVAQGVMNRLSTVVSENNYPGIAADFSYQEEFPLSLDFKEGGFLEPKSYEMDIVIGKYCFFEYKFYYNTKFPVMVTLYDKNSNLDNNGYMFQFPLMVVLKNNFPKVKYDTRDSIDTSDKMKTYQCSPEQRLSDRVTVNVTDEKGKPVDNAHMTFQCGPGYIYDYDANGSVENVTNFANKCFIGKTDSEGLIDENLPPCHGGGIIEVSAPNHLTKLKYVESIEEAKAYNFTINLPSVVKKRIVVDKYFVEPPVPKGLTIKDDNPAIKKNGNKMTLCRMDKEKLPIESNEKVIVRLKKLDEENGIMQEKPFGLYTTSENTSISLAPGRYRADLMLIRNEKYPGEMTIDAKSQVRKAGDSMTGGGEDLYYPEEDVNLPTVTTGGAVYEFEITPADVYRSDKIRFHIIDEGKPQYVENIGRGITDREGCSRINYDKLKPEIE